MSEEIKTENKPVKKKGKKALKVILCILCAILLFVAVTVCVSAIGDKANMKKAQSFEKINYENQLVPEKDELGNYTFTADRELKVVQITDVHIGGGWMSLKKDAMALNTVAAMLTAEKPDFVIVTGDIAYPVPFQAGTFNNKISAKIFAELMDTLGVYWTLGFGNHDTEAYSFYSREDISEFYSSGDYEYLIYQPGPEDVSGCGNQVVNVKNSDGIITQSMYILDSHSYTDGDILGVMWKYDNLHDDQVEWYAGMVKKYDEINAAAAGKAGTEPQKINSLMFFHIPLTEMKDAWYEYIENGFKDTDNVKYVYGDAGEPKKVVYCGIGDDGMFEKIQELGSTKAVFCGHDHKNNFSVMYKGIQLTYGMSVDYLAYPGIYKLGSQRGCTIINIRPDGTYECHPENYYQDKYRSLYEKEPVTMQKVEQVSEIPAE
ncbi:MAG: metallophosphoesterase [Clostridia bacterium]|nr:metallophosphoesterase [Clostridia bacterium]